MGAHLLPRARLEPPAVRAIGRERVDRCFDRAWDVPLTVVVGPAGAGKSTAASHLVQRSPHPAVWYRAHPVDGHEEVFSAHLAEAITRAIGGADSWPTLAELPVELERRVDAIDHERVMVVIDEFDAVIGTESERALGGILHDLAPIVHLVTLSRHRPHLNLTRLRLGGDVCEIGPDDLRFRSWEISRLFHEQYGHPLPPDEVAELERRTGGWVAALQLFNLATRTMPAQERRATISHVGRRSGPDWDFLAENVLAGLPDDLQRFLLDTSPFERLTPELCDELRGAADSAAFLDELEQLQLVTSSMEAPGSYRSHEVLRSHLESMLREQEGADAVLGRYRRAAATLERHELYAEALLAHCRGEDWSSAGRLLGSRGAEVAGRPGSWLVGLPSSLVQSDPWLLLAVARQQRADGRIADAIATFQSVERSSLSSAPVTIARRERLLLASLVDGSSRPSLAWVAAIRDAAIGDPVGAVAGLEPRSAHDDLALGIGRLLGGEIHLALGTLRSARDRPDASPTVALAADIAAVIAAQLAGAGTQVDADLLERSAAVLDVPFLVRLARAATAMVTGAAAECDDVIGECERAGDRVGAAIAATLATLASVWGGGRGGGRPPPGRADALARCREAGLGTLEMWVTVADALRSSTDGGLADLESLARRKGIRPMQQLAALASATAHGAAGDDVAAMVGRIRSDHGLTVRASLGPRAHDAAATPATTATTTTTTAATTPTATTTTTTTGGSDADDSGSHPRSHEMGGGAARRLEVRCLGPFSVARGPHQIDLGALRPRARSVLRMLAANVGSGVHRQVLCEALWPADDEATATRKLQVAVSSIRRLLDSGGPTELVRRDGEVYRLVGDVVDCDVERFAAVIARGRSALAASRQAEATAAFRAALELYRGDLLADEGAAEWVIAPRLELQTSVTDAARCLAELLLDADEPAEAVEVCRTGLGIDRYCDPLWRALLRALRADDDLAGHALALGRYDAVLAELGVQRPAPAR